MQQTRWCICQQCFCQPSCATSYRNSRQCSGRYKVFAEESNRSRGALSVSHSSSFYTSFSLLLFSFLLFSFLFFSSLLFSSLVRYYAFNKSMTTIPTADHTLPIGGAINTMASLLSQRKKRTGGLQGLQNKCKEEKERKTHKYVARYACESDRRESLLK
jgi:hypothetical protein